MIGCYLSALPPLLKIAHYINKTLTDTWRHFDYRNPEEGAHKDVPKFWIAIKNDAAKQNNNCKSIICLIGCFVVRCTV
jgi:hypothetical protein